MNIVRGRTYSANQLKEDGLVPLVSYTDGSCIYTKQFGSTGVGAERWYLVPAGTDSYRVDLTYSW